MPTAVCGTMTKNWRREGRCRTEQALVPEEVLYRSAQVVPMHPAASVKRTQSLCWLHGLHLLLWHSSMQPAGFSPLKDACDCFLWAVLRVSVCLNRLPSESEDSVMAGLAHASARAKYPIRMMGMNSTCTGASSGHSQEAVLMHPLWVGPLATAWVLVSRTIQAYIVCSISQYWMLQCWGRSVTPAGHAGHVVVRRTWQPGVTGDASMPERAG